MPLSSYLDQISTKRKLIFASVLFFIFLFFGFFLRTTGIPSGNILFLFDNGRDLLFVKKIVIDHHPILIGPSSGGLQGYFHGVLWYYLLSIPFFISHGNPIFITSFVAFLSLLSVALTFFILNKVSGLSAAIIGSFLFTFSAFSVQTAKYPWNPYPVIWLMPLFFYSLFLASKKNNLGIILGAFLIGLFIHFEAIYGITLLPTFLILLIWSVKINPTSINRFKIFLGSLIAFGLPTVPTLLFDLRHNFLITRSLLGAFTSGGASVTHKNSEVVLPIVSRFDLRFHDLINYTINSLTPNIWINLFIFIVSVSALIILIKQNKIDKFIFLVIISIITPVFLFPLLRFEVWSYYWIGTSPLFAIGVSYLIGKLDKLNQVALYPIGLICLVGILLFNPISSIKNWSRGNLPDIQTNLNTEMKIVNAVKNDAGTNPYSVYVSTPPVYDYVYRYLFWRESYLGNKNFPNDLKQKEVYVILEINQSGNYEDNYFLTKVVHTKQRPEEILNTPYVKVLKIQTLPSEPPFDSSFIPVI